MYDVVKWLHVLAVVLTIGGMLTAALVLRWAAPTGAGGGTGVPQPLAEAVSRWDRRVTGPALGLAWMAGFSLAAGAGWLSSPWLIVKLALVLGLSAVQGLQSSRLRALSSGAPAASPVVWLSSQPFLVVGLVACIIFLAVIKPFS